MDEQEYHKKYVNLRILKGIQEYLKSGTDGSTALFPIRVPDELLYLTLRYKGAEKVDHLIHQIFRMGLSFWSEKLYNDVFGSQESLEEFIDLVKDRNK